MGGSNSTTLVFLGTCLLFAETALSVLAGLTDANSTIVAGFAFGALAMVLTALVVMYKIDPAFLTLSGAQALDLRRLQALLDETALANLPPELQLAHLKSLATLPDRDLERGETEEFAEETETVDEEADEIEAADEAMSRRVGGG
jgi:hypothetical protein